MLMYYITLIYRSTSGVKIYIDTAKHNIIAALLQAYNLILLEESYGMGEWGMGMRLDYWDVQ